MTVGHTQGIAFPQWYLHTRPRASPTLILCSNARRSSLMATIATGVFGRGRDAAVLFRMVVHALVQGVVDGDDRTGATIAVGRRTMLPHANAQAEAMVGRQWMVRRIASRHAGFVGGREQGQHRRDEIDLVAVQGNVRALRRRGPAVRRVKDGGTFLCGGCWPSSALSLKWGGVLASGSLVEQSKQSDQKQ